MVLALAVLLRHMIPSQAQNDQPTNETHNLILGNQFVNQSPRHVEDAGSQKETDTGKIPKDVVNKATISTVIVRTPTGHGAGFFITTNGYLLTNYHVIEGATQAVVETKDGGKYPVQYICGYSPKLDIVRLKVKGQNFQCLQLAASSKINLDDSIFIIGHPYGHMWTMTKGYIAGKHREDDRPTIQVSADISPGTSGGPILLYDGTVCGVATCVENRSIRFTDGNYILDPSKVLKFGISVDAFLTATNIQGNERYTLTQVTEFNSKFRTLRLLAGILEITHERLMDLGKELTRMQFNNEAIYFDEVNFKSTARRLIAAVEYFNDRSDKTSEKTIDAAVLALGVSVKAALSSISFIVEADRTQTITISDRVANARKCFNSSIASMTAALSGTEKALKLYDLYIVNPIVQPSRISELRKRYESGQLKL
jgi:hypothetical protein